jgi:hypothetical protein
MAMRVLRNRTQRQELVEEFRGSGLGRHALCRLNGILPSTFKTWLREFVETCSRDEQRPPQGGLFDQNTLRKTARRA